MTERPILFSAPMVCALFAGMKTQTRRVVKPQPRRVDGGVPFGDAAAWAHAEPGSAVMRCPYGQRGDRLWVRETWLTVNGDDTFYRADYMQDRAGDRAHGVAWRPSIHMPRSRSRITLEVTGVRVERLQDISEADAVAEGVFRKVGTTQLGDVVETATGGELIYAVPTQARKEYRRLWDTINGDGAWAANPWVWVVTFKKINPTGKP